MVYRNRCWSLTVFSFLLFGSAAAGHAGTLTGSWSGKSQYTVQGTELEGFAGTDVMIQYDKTALKNPRVTQGGLVSSAMMVSDVGHEGIVRIATIDKYPKTNSGTGTIAVIDFDMIGTSSGAATIDKSSKVLDVNGVRLSLSFTDPNVAGNGLEGNYGGANGTTTESVPSAGNTVWLGGNVNVPVDGAMVEAKVRDEASVTAPEPQKIDETAVKGQALTAGQSVQPAAKQDSSDKSVLEQFREFQGEKTPKTLVALFTRALDGSRQQPPVVLSDGKSSVTVFVDVPSGKTFPHFALTGARLVSLKKSGGTTWVVEAVPAKGTFESTLTVMQDGAAREIPLAVAPPLAAELKLGGEGKLTEADFNRFLSERGNGKAVLFDLNGDGKRDYVDDYIFTANFLAQAGAGKVAAAKQSQKQMR